LAVVEVVPDGVAEQLDERALLADGLDVELVAHTCTGERLARMAQ
jgi:hypothetical protein